MYVLLMDIALLEEQQAASLTVYHVCISDGHCSLRGTGSLTDSISCMYITVHHVSVCYPT